MFKKFLLIAFLFVTASAFSQVRKPVFMVPDSTTAYGVTMPANSLVFDYGANRLWTLTSSVLATDDVSTSSKILVTESGGGGSDLATTLGLGNTSGASDISLDDGQILKATNGDGLLNLRAGATNGSVELKGSTGVYNQGGVFGLSGASFMNLNPLSVSFGLFNQTFTKAGQMVVVDTDLNPFNTSASPTFPTSFSNQGWTINSGVFNTSVISGANGIAKTSNIAYTNQIGFNNGGSFETRLSHTVATSDNDILLPDNSGTVAILTDSESKLNVGSVFQATTQSGFGSVGYDGHDLTTAALYFRSIGTARTVLNSPSGSNVDVRVGGSPRWTFGDNGSLTTGITSLGVKIGLTSGSTYGLGIQSGLFEIIGSNASSDYTFGYGTSGSLTRLMTLKGTGELGIGTTTPSADAILTASGNVETTGAGNGLIVEDELDGNRYRIHTENGNLFVELVP